MGVRMFGQFMDMFMFMALGDMQPDTQTHQDFGYKEPNGKILPKDDHRDHRANKRCG